MPITPNSQSLKKGRRGLGCILTFFTLFGVVMSAVFLWPVFEIQDAKSWQAVPCKILSSKVESHSSSKGGPTYSVEVMYEYYIDDHRYVGTRYKFMGGSSSGREGKQEIVDRLGPGTEATCYVNRRNPTDCVIERGFTGDIFFGLIPLTFAAFGVFGIIAVFFRQPKVIPGQHPGLPAAARGSATLKAKNSRGCLLVFALVFAGIWNTVVSFYVAEMVTAWRNGHGEGCATVFMIPFVLVGLGLIVLVGYCFLSLFNPRPVLKLSTTSVALGDEIEVEWNTPGSVDRVRACSITLEGREEATYRRGTSTSTDKSPFARIELMSSSKGRELRRGKAKFTIPRDSMHTFKSSHNKFVWAIHVKGDIPMWPDIGEEYEVEVLPQRISPGGAA